MRSIDTLMREGEQGAKKKTATVVDPDNEVGPEILAKAIVEVSEAAKKLLGGPLSERAIVILIQDAAGYDAGGTKQVSQATIKAVLHAAAGGRGVRDDRGQQLGEGHDACKVVVLDLEHDPLAAMALWHYAHLCDRENPARAEEYRALAHEYGNKHRARKGG